MVIKLSKHNNYWWYSRICNRTPYSSLLFDKCRKSFSFHWCLYAFIIMPLLRNSHFYILRYLFPEDIRFILLYLSLIPTVFFQLAQLFKFFLYNACGTRIETLWNRKFLLTTLLMHQKSPTRLLWLARYSLTSISYIDLLLWVVILVIQTW